MYRRTRKYQERRKARGRTGAAENAQQPPHLQPPSLRKRLIVIDYDGPVPVMHTIELYRSNRCDSYHALFDGKPWTRHGQRTVGWSLILDGLRRAVPRAISARALAED